MVQPCKESGGAAGVKAEKPRVLIVDDDRDMLQMLVRLIERRCDCVISTAETGDGAWALLESFAPDVVITDIRMPGLDGMDLLEKVVAREPGISVIIMTGFGNVELAVQALQRGAYDFIEKPFDKDRIIHSLGRCLERVRLLQENRCLQETLKGKKSFAGFEGCSSRLREVFDLIGKVADTDVTVLIRGESGTGKELAARALHALSRRAARCMVTVNCPALPVDILESELFGYVRGAFTGAVQDKKGLFFEADGSTLLLDEIGDLPIHLQTKLLRVLQEKEIMPLGQTRSIPVNVRVLASTNQDLEAKIHMGQFREDLFYRLNVVTVTMPSLADRPEDIPLLAGCFLKQYCAEYSRSGLFLAPEAERDLMRRPWKGNVRELQNVLKRAVLLAAGPEITLADLGTPHVPGEGLDAALPEAIRHLGYNEAKDEVLSRFSRAYLANSLKKSGGNVTAAAHASGLGRQAFQRLLRRAGLVAEEFRSEGNQVAG